MRHNITSLIGYSMEATDGDIGKVEDFYFEDTTWVIRYFILKTGNWFTNRKVLISPQAIGIRATESEVFPVNLTKEQIRTSPDIDTDKPVSEQQDLELYGHYAWQRYGGNAFYAGSTAAVMENLPVLEEKLMKKADDPDESNKDDFHLRSIQTIMGYHIHGYDGDFGHITDFIIDDADWHIIYLVVESDNWFAGKKFYIKTGTVKEIQWENSKVVLDISMEAIKECTVFDK